MANEISIMYEFRAGEVKLDFNKIFAVTNQIVVYIYISHEPTFAPKTGFGFMAS